MTGEHPGDFAGLMKDLARPPVIVLTVLPILLMVPAVRLVWRRRRKRETPISARDDRAAKDKR